MPDEVQRCVQWDAGFDEAPAMIRVGHSMSRTFFVVERLPAVTGDVKEPRRFELRALRPHPHHTGVVLEVEILPLPSLGHGGPAALVLGARLGLPVLVGIGLRHGAGPMLLDPVLEMHAALGAEERGERRFRFGRALQFHQADEHALRLGGGQIVDQPAFAAQAQAASQKKQSQHDARRGCIVDGLVHAPRL